MFFVVQGSLKDACCNHLKHGFFFFYQHKGTPPSTRQCSGVKCKDPCFLLLVLLRETSRKPSFEVSYMKSPFSDQWAFLAIRAKSGNETWNYGPSLGFLYRESVSFPHSLQGLFGSFFLSFFFLGGGLVRKPEARGFHRKWETSAESVSGIEIGPDSDSDLWAGLGQLSGRVPEIQGCWGYHLNLCLCVCVSS